MGTVIDIKKVYTNLHNNLIKEIKRIYAKNKLGTKIDDKIYLEDLPFIQRLNLNFPGYLGLQINNKPFISYLTGLKKISFVGPFKSDQSLLDQIPNKEQLTELEITNSDMSTIDLSAFPNLKTLTIVDNEQLRTIRGLDKLNNLEYLEFYNNQFVSENSICKLITGLLEHKATIKVDYMYYPTVSKMIRREYSKYSEAFKGAEWVERINPGKMADTIVYSTESIANFFSDLSDKLNEIIPVVTTDDLDGIYLIYCWIVNNTNYDYDGLKNKLRMHSTPVEMHLDGKVQKIRLASGHIGGTNGAVNTFYSHSGVCEGYTRLFQLLLKLFLVDSHNLLAHAEKEFRANAKAPTTTDLASAVRNHSITEVYYDGKPYYCDTTNEDIFSKNGEITQACFMKTFEELTINCFPVGYKVTRGVEPISEERRKQLSTLKVTDHYQVDVEKKGLDMMEKFQLHLTGETENVSRECQIKKEQALDLLLLRMINKKTLDFIKNTIDNEYLELINSKAKKV